MAQDKKGLIGVAEVIGHLRRELEEAQAQAVGEGLKFTVTSMDVELQVVASRDKTGNGKVGVKFWVVEAGAGESRKVSLQETQKVVLRLKPQQSDHEDLLVSDKVKRPWEQKE